MFEVEKIMRKRLGIVLIATGCLIGVAFVYFSLPEKVPLNNEPLLPIVLTIYDKQPFKVAPSSEKSFPYKNKRDGILLDVDAIEQFGSDIEVDVILNGEKIYSSGVCAGRVKKELSGVSSGYISMVIKNGDLLESKKGIITIKSVEDTSKYPLR